MTGWTLCKPTLPGSTCRCSCCILRPLFGGSSSICKLSPIQPKCVGLKQLQDVDDIQHKRWVLTHFSKNAEQNKSRSTLCVQCHCCIILYSVMWSGACQPSTWTAYCTVQMIVSHWPDSNLQLTKCLGLLVGESISLRLTDWHLQAVCFLDDCNVLWCVLCATDTDVCKSQKCICFMMI